MLLIAVNWCYIQFQAKKSPISSKQQALCKSSKACLRRFRHLCNEFLWSSEIIRKSPKNPSQVSKNGQSEGTIEELCLNNSWSLLNIKMEDVFSPAKFLVDSYTGAPWNICPQHIAERACVGHQKAAFINCKGLTSLQRLPGKTSAKNDRW